MPEPIDVPDALWDRVRPLLPPDSAKTGRPRADARACLAGIAYVLRTGCAWRKLPARELGVSYPSCWRRMRDWAAAGVWPAVHREVLRELGAAAEAGPVRGDRRQRQPAGGFGGTHAGPNPVDRAKAGCKRHLVVDRGACPLVVHLTPANVRDDAPVPALLAKLSGVPLRRRPREFYADRGYGFAWTVAQVRAAGMAPRIPPRGSPHGSGLGKVRCAVEWAMAWFCNFRRLRACYERTLVSWQAMHDLAAAMICLKKLVPDVQF